MDPKSIGLKTKEGNWEFRPGPKVKDWNPYKVLPTLTNKTISWIENQSVDKPFFLYLALPSPHAPIIPNDAFIGKSNAGGYGDFMVQTDWVVGQVLETLKNQGLEDNTLVIFSSDNGPENGVGSAGKYRGRKRSVHEGGIKIPCLWMWEGKFKPFISDEFYS